jgi:hypothetical protein
MWGILAVLYGEWAKRLLEGTLPTVGAVLFVILVLTGTTYFVWRVLKRRSQQGVI